MNGDLQHLLALLNIKGIGSATTRQLIEQFGSAKDVLEARVSDLSNIGNIGELVLSNRSDPAIMVRAEAEIEFIEKNNIQSLIYGQKGYPHRLLDCPDAPEVLFKLGSADLDSKHIISIVGTRSCSQYGRDNVSRFVEDISHALPDTIIVSGLALGIDISAHEASLTNHLTTAGVVAHGLDTIYPYVHRSIASKIVSESGCLVTEYPSHTTPERGNFIARNRIIAGLADAVVIAESKDKGGSLVTASIALDYGRDVFAFPGRVNDILSEGCNRLIRLNRAGLITSANDFLEAMNWTSNTTSRKSVQHTIDFDDSLSSTEHTIIDTLRQRGDLRLNQISIITHIEPILLNEALLNLELSGKVRNIAGGLYQLR